MKPPIAEQRLHRETHHGIVKDDPYAWLRDDNWQQVMHEPDCLDGDIRAYLEAENAYTEYNLEPLSDMRDRLFAEMRGRIEPNETTIPQTHGAFAWNTRYREGDEHPMICRGHPNCGPTETDVVLDGNIAAQGQDYFKLANYQPTDDGRFLAWAADHNGSEYLIIHIRDTHTQTELPDRIERASADLVWSQCGNYLFYIVIDEHHRPHRVMRHQRGTDPSDDSCVYEEADRGFFLGLDQTASGAYIVISAYDHETSESWVIPSDDPLSEAVCVAPRQTGIEYYPEHDPQRDRFIILTNWQKDWQKLGLAEDFQLVVASGPELTGSQENWQTLVPAKPSCLILSFNVFKDHMCWLARVDALCHLNIQHFETGETHEISLAEPAYDLTMLPNTDYAQPILHYSYASMTTPRASYAYDLNTHQAQLMIQQTVPSGHAPRDYITARLWADADDGARIPISVLYHKDTPLDGSAPTLLYGYGAYGLSIPAGFAASRLSLVDRGFIYAIAHIRGGKDCGYHWYAQGRRAQKKNSFLDFIAAARALIAQNYSRAGNISIHGGSAGGLLVGAVVNMAPELFCAAIAEVPFVDNLTTMLDADLPLTPPEWPEWGNPILNKDDYETIAAYAPYENIRATSYPHILATAGLTDPRVTYWEPAKWVARLRATRTDDRLTLLKTEMFAGHGGPAGRYVQLRETALIYSFLLNCHTIEPSSV